MRRRISIGSVLVLAMLGSCATPAAQPFRVVGDPSLVSHADFAAIVDVVRRDLARMSDNPPIKAVAIVSHNKAIVTYRTGGPLEWDFCVVERSLRGWRITQHNSSIA